VETLHTALHDAHLDAGATMQAYDGWDLPAHYGDLAGELAEAHARAVVVDLSHLGRFRISGDEALDLLEAVCTCDVARQEDDTCRRTLLCGDDGRLIDLCVLARLDDHWMLTCSPARCRTVADHLGDHAAARKVKVKDVTENTTMLWICGPAGAQLLDPVLPEKVSPLPRGTARAGSYLIAKYVAMRNGMTTLWSLEVTLPKLRERYYYENSKYGYCRGTEPVNYVQKIKIYYDILRRKGIEYQR